MKRSRSLAFALLLAMAGAILPGVVQSLDAGAFDLEALRPENARQRRLDEIQELPKKTVPCPVCDFGVEVPLADKLMLKTPPPAETAWRMEAAYRDTDFCPYPAPGKVSWQADVVICPNCGYAAEAKSFGQEVSDEAAEWVLANLQPALREAQAGLLGWRRGEMTDEEVAVFFNSQSEIPDVLRLEHWLTCLDGGHAPPLERAKGCWRSAWAFRRQLAANPRSEIFARHAVELQNELKTANAAGDDLHSEITALRALLRKKRQGQSGLPGAVDMTGRLLLAGLWDRHGFLGEAEKLLQGLYHECRERFLRHEQDPLWGETSQRASKTHRLNELELMRTDAEREVFMRLEMVRGEQSRLTAASELIRKAVRNGELDGKPKEALFYSYLTGEFLRRAGNLPLASEWLKNLVSLAGEETPVGKLATRQLNCVGEEAGDKVNLLSAFGQDGDLFARLRGICGGGTAK